MKSALDALAQSGRLDRADVALAAWLARGFPDATPEVALAAALAARAVADGHSALALDQAQAWLAGLAEDKLPALPGVSAWRNALQHSPAVHVAAGDAPSRPLPLVLDAQGRIYLRRYFEYERQLAQSLVVRAGPDGARSPVPGSWSPNHDLDPGQQRAIDTALARRFTLITGGPGSGKTFSVAHVLAALSRDGATRIALAAPTGKAAARLIESLRLQLARMHLPAAVADRLPRTAATLHRLLGISPWRPQPHHHRDAPLPFDVVVVDEASMVDLPLMARLTDALGPGTRLVLLGDPNQLSAVEAGNVLPALVEAAATPPFEACHVALSSSHRFDATSALGALAQAIVLGDAGAALAALHDGSDAARLVADGSPAALVEQAHAGFASIPASADAGAALAAARGFRVLTALRRGPQGCIALNRAIEARLKRARGERADAEWWRGRLVMVIANRPELELFNGDIGVVWPDADGAMQAWFEAADGAPRKLPVAALPPHEGAFALTVHKAQGSEFERVALVAGPDSAVLTRELLYTGVTRARAGVTIHATPEILRIGITRRTLRMTGLADRLREAAQSAGT